MPSGWLRWLVKRLAWINCRLGLIVPELSNEAVRELSLYSYRILYEIKTTHIEVLAVIHKRRDLQPDEILREQ
ncbi:type II toxin-antitoxin system RelE/ParE family toxin [Methylomonas sp. HW2-6]|uniref:type II toxin-antitoxin system RelE/ParE family toxin n=1 Tax=Methylomonas sp. HW2-6 TaxID=3376687 RepID=UPI004042C612